MAGHPVGNQEQPTFAKGLAELAAHRGQKKAPA